MEPDCCHQTLIEHFHQQLDVLTKSNRICPFAIHKVSRILVQSMYPPVRLSYVIFQNLKQAVLSKTQVQLSKIWKHFQKLFPSTWYTLNSQIQYNQVKVTNIENINFKHINSLINSRGDAGLSNSKTGQPDLSS